MAQNDSSSVAGKRVRNSLEHRLLGVDGLSEVAGDDAAEIVEVLDDVGAVQAELLHEDRMALGRYDALAGHGLHGIAGKHADKGKGDDGDPDEGRDQDGEAAENEPQHSGPRFRSGSGCFGLQRGRMEEAPRRALPSQFSLLGDVDAGEAVMAERAHHVAGDLGAHRHHDQRMVERGPRRLALEDDLRLFIEGRALGLVGDDLGVVHELVELLVAPLRAVVAADGVTAEQGVEEVVRIAVVAGPAEDHRAVAVSRRWRAPGIPPIRRRRSRPSPRSARNLPGSAQPPAGR